MSSQNAFDALFRKHCLDTMAKTPELTKLMGLPPVGMTIEEKADFAMNAAVRTAVIAKADVDIRAASLAALYSLEEMALPKDKGIEFVLFMVSTMVFSYAMEVAKESDAPVLNIAGKIQGFIAQLSLDYTEKQNANAKQQT